jgi:hypothetical protein
MLAHEWLRLPGGELIKAMPSITTPRMTSSGARMSRGTSPARPRSWVSTRPSWPHAYTRPVDGELLEFLVDAYLSFRLGQSALSTQMTDAQEQALHRRPPMAMRRHSAPASLQEKPKRLSSNPRSVCKRNEPPREQTGEQGLKKKMMKVESAF